jgi:spore maturation protein SpmB
MTSFYDQVNGWLDMVIRFVQSILALIGIKPESVGEMLSISQ